MKKLRVSIALMLALACFFALSACAKKDNTPSGGADLSKVYQFGFNTWGTAPNLMIYGDECQYGIDSIGMKGSRSSDDNNADKELQNIQNFIAAGVNGLCVQAAGSTTAPQMATEALNAKIPFVLYVFTGTPEFRDDLAANNAYYYGACAPDLDKDGYILGQQAIKDGCTKACIIGGNIGDLNMDRRQSGFTNAFTEGGGTVLDVARCTDNSEALTKASAMLSANKDVDCVYIMAGDFAPGMLNAIDTLQLPNVKAYLSSIDKNSAQYIRDGQITVGSGGTALSCNIAPALLLNALDGHPIKDSDGKPPYFQIPTSLVTKDNVDAFVDAFFGDTKAVSQDVIKNLCYRYNPNVTYQTFVDTINNDLTIDAIIKSHSK